LPHKKHQKDKSTPVKINPNYFSRIKNKQKSINIDNVAQKLSFHSRNDGKKWREMTMLKLKS